MLRSLFVCLFAAVHALPTNFRAELPLEASNVVLTTFDGQSSTTQAWKDVNDPVMGGRSVSTFKVDKSAGVGIFDGETKIVPSLHAPGFCNMQAERAQFPDVSRFADGGALKLVARSTIGYTGFKASFGPAPRHGFFSSYKADFNISVGSDFVAVIIPFDRFSSHWDDKTGEPVVTCAKDKSVCPDKEHLARLSSLEISAEGVAGKFHLEIKSISVISVTSTRSRLLEPATDATLYKITGAKCGQATLDAKYAKYAEKFASLKEGTCASQGYTVANGTQTLNVPVLGAITISLFLKPQALAIDSALLLATFDGSSTDHRWIEENDPVMGGKSTNCTFSHNKAAKLGVFQGVVEDVPALKAPGFCFARQLGLHKLGDASSFSKLQIVYKSDVAYAGFKAAFVADTWNTQFGAFKADFKVSAAQGLQTLTIPFASFSNKWSSATGEPTAKSPPTAKNLHDMSQLQIWAEGTKGPFNLQIKSISAV